MSYRLEFRGNLFVKCLISLNRNSLMVLLVFIVEFFEEDSNILGSAPSFYNWSSVEIIGRQMLFFQNLLVNAYSSSCKEHPSQLHYVFWRILGIILYDMSNVGQPLSCVRSKYFGQPKILLSSSGVVYNLHSLPFCLITDYLAASQIFFLQLFLDIFNVIFHLYFEAVINFIRIRLMSY